MVSLGTRFIVTEESMAPRAQKEMIISSSIEDLVFTDEISELGASFLKQTITKFRRPAQGPVQFNVAQEIGPKVWEDYWSPSHLASSHLHGRRSAYDRFLRDDLTDALASVWRAEVRFPRKPEAPYPGATLAFDPMQK